MLDLFVIPSADRRLIPEGQVIRSHALGHSDHDFPDWCWQQQRASPSPRLESDVSDDLASRATVQIIEANPDLQETATNRRCGGTACVVWIWFREVRILPQEEVEEFIEPWIGVSRTK